MAQVRTTQAVIVIHGIGEQRPMSTLRGFVDAVLPEHEDGIKYFSRPDSISSTYELRILQNRKQPRTHFFEYYWAYKVEGTKMGHLLGWLKTLLLRWPWQVTGQLLPLWLISWALILAIAISLLLGRIDTDFFKVSGIAALVLSALQGTVLLWLGDAARYLSPSPSNIRMRQNIRADGIDLVRKIVDSGDYDRVIVVGHSLGSVIGYDILKHLWYETNAIYKLTRKVDQKALRRVEELGERLRAGDAGVSVDDYQEAQVALWKELRKMGNPWLVTDFITLGSPLTHAALLLARDKDDLVERQKQRELPTCPPVAEVSLEGEVEVRRYSYSWFRYGKNRAFKPWVIHHAGLFAPTRWTNLYFPARLGLFGDIVGGPLAPWFGPGIRDVPVSSANPLRNLTLWAHVSYWGKRLKGRIPAPLEALIRALNLDEEDLFAS